MERADRVIWEIRFYITVATGPGSFNTTTQHTHATHITSSLVITVSAQRRTRQASSYARAWRSCSTALLCLSLRDTIRIKKIPCKFTSKSVPLLRSLGLQIYCLALPLDQLVNPILLGKYIMLCSETERLDRGEAQSSKTTVRQYAWQVLFSFSTNLFSGGPAAPDGTRRDLRPASFSPQHAKGLCQCLLMSRLHSILYHVRPS